MKTPFIFLIPLIFLADNATAADANDIQLLDTAKISLTDAVTRAEKHIGGKAIEANLDDHGTQAVFEVEVVKDAKVFDVDIDAVTGKVIRSYED